MKVDKEALWEQYLEESKKNGAVLHVYLNKVSPLDILKGNALTPMIDSKIRDSFTAGALLVALDSFKEMLLKKPGAKESYNFLKSGVVASYKVNMKEAKDNESNND